MADGRTHAAANGGVLTLVVASGALLSLAVPTTEVYAVAAGASAGALAGLLITPDIDQPGITYEERRVMRYLGPIGYLWFLYWLPYGLFMPHRGYSHTVPQGTLGRLLYATLPWLILTLWLGIRLSAAWLPYLPYALVALVLAWCVQDLTHLALDGLWPGRAPWKRPRWQQRHNK